MQSNDVQRAKRKRSYICLNNQVICYPSAVAAKITEKFVEWATLSEFHDEDLQQCTRELNATIDKYKDLKKSENEELSFLVTPKGLFLAWTVDAESVTGEDDDETILTALDVKR